jgi:cytosine/adenosine deaminase-related metal-dependent hydrolase
MFAITNAQLFTITNGIKQGDILINDSGRIVDLGPILKAGLSMEDALIGVTKNVAKKLRIDTDYGSLEPGKYVDLVLWDCHPFNLTSKVKKVWIKGQLVYQ